LQASVRLGNGLRKRSYNRPVVVAARRKGVRASARSRRLRAACGPLGRQAASHGGQALPSCRARKRGIDKCNVISRRGCGWRPASRGWRRRGRRGSAKRGSSARPCWQPINLSASCIIAWICSGFSVSRTERAASFAGRRAGQGDNRATLEEGTRQLRRGSVAIEGSKFGRGGWRWGKTG
jgi:hypothetical protein